MWNFDPIKQEKLTDNILIQNVIPSYKSCKTLRPLSGEIY